MNWRMYLLLLSTLSNPILTSCKPNDLIKRGPDASVEAPSNTQRRGDAIGSSKIPRIEKEDGTDAASEVTISEEASIATDVTGAFLKMPKGISELGAAFGVRTLDSRSQAQWQRYRMTLPTRTIEDPHLVVLYHIQKEGKYYYGLIPKTDLQMESGSITFKLEGPGIYQAARTPIFTQKIPDVSSEWTQIWSPVSSSTITTLGKPFDFDVLDRALFIVSDRVIEYVYLSTTETRVLSRDSNLRRIAMANLRPFSAMANRGVGFFSVFNVAPDSYQGLFTTATSAGASFELGSTRNNSNILILLEENSLAGNVGQLSFYDVSVPSPAFIRTQALVRRGTKTMTLNTTNGSNTIGPLIVRPSRIYAILSDGVHSLVRTGETSFEQGPVIEEGLDQAFCLAPAQQDTLLFVCHKQQRIAAISTALNNKPILLQDLDIGEPLVGLAVHQQKLFALTRSSRLFVYELGEGDRLAPIGVHNLGLANGTPDRIKIINDFIYIGHVGPALTVLGL